MTRYVDPNAQAIRERREGIAEYPMIWITGLNRETGVPESVGLWTGPVNEIVTVVDMFTGVSQAREFYGQGELVGIEDFNIEAGLTFRTTEVVLSGIGPAAQQAIRGYEPRGAKVQVWKRCYDPRSMIPVAAEPWFKGFVNSAPIERPTPNGTATITLGVVSVVAFLTLVNGLKKSHAAQKKRHPGDTFRVHKASIAKIEVPWGTDIERIKST